MGGKVKIHNLSEGEIKKNFGDFYLMASLLQDKEDAKKFFKDLLTTSEMVMITRRIQIAKRLLRGESYEEIIERMKVGKTTIGQVDRWLNYGFGGYKDIIKKYKEENKKRTKRYNKNIEGYFPFSFKYLRKKHPAHFALINLLMDDD